MDKREQTRFRGSEAGDDLTLIPHDKTISVLLVRYDGDESFSIEVRPQEARLIAQKFIEYAERVEALQTLQK
jgi:hypothetical protein